MRLMTHLDPHPQILLVEDDELLLEVMEAALDRQGYSYISARTAQEAIEKAYRLKPELVLLDVNLPDQSGFLVAAKLKVSNPSPKVVFMTALPRGQCDRIATFVRAEGVMHKPFALKKLISTVDRLLGVAQAA